MAAVTDKVQSLKGMLRKPGRPVSIEDMNQAIAKQFDRDEWDRQIARDSELGRLDSLIEQAKRDYAEERGREL
jgi:hypothetical protein